MSVGVAGCRSNAGSLLACAAVAQVFVEAGAGPSLVEYLEPSLAVVRDALEACRSRLPALPDMGMIIDWLEAHGRVVELDPVHVLAVDDLSELYPGAESGPGREEIATVYGGLQLQAQGHLVAAVLDGALGRSLGRRAGLSVASVPELVSAMVDEGALPEELAGSILPLAPCDDDRTEGGDARPSRDSREACVRFASALGPSTGGSSRPLVVLRQRRSHGEVHPRP